MPGPLLETSLPAWTACQRRVIDYFTETQDDYRRLWGTDRHHGMHCGFHEGTIRRHDEAVRHMNQVLAVQAGITPSDRVLDAGCGIGGSALWLADAIGCAVVGVNIHAGQLEQARRLADSRGLAGRVAFHLADFAATGLADASFDVVWALESLCYAERKAAFAAESFRLLRPGGRLVVADAFLTREALSPAEQRIVGRWRDGWAIPDVVTVRQFEHSLRQAGFRAVGCRDITPQVAPSSLRIYLGSLVLYPARLVLHWLGLRSAMQTRGIASGFYQYRARRRGLGIYAIVVARK